LESGLLGRVLRKSETGVPDLAPAIYAHTIAALEALKARSRVSDLLTLITAEARETLRTAARS